MIPETEYRQLYGQVQVIVSTNAEQGRQIGSMGKRLDHMDVTLAGIATQLAMIQATLASLPCRSPSGRFIVNGCDHDAETRRARWIAWAIQRVAPYMAGVITGLAAYLAGR